MKQGQTANVGIGVAAEYRGSGKTRAEFCRERGIAVTMLDYYLRRDGAKGRQRLEPVRVEEEKERGQRIHAGAGEWAADRVRGGLRRDRPVTAGSRAGAELSDVRNGAGDTGLCRDWSDRHA